MKLQIIKLEENMTKLVACVDQGNKLPNEAGVYSIGVLPYMQCTYRTVNKICIKLTYQSPLEDVFLDFKLEAFTC